ncbi:hypothetical protein E2C01_013374 [Portunus trituberculatus]|uniref:Uncharacterized protein n=1 Tax=Portunus trituberculatus TaxID=210409 RepID=A0A5B7DG31_PORTR|nr:hypothetical protein [Portunus trituberculatus]
MVTRLRKATDYPRQTGASNRDDGGGRSRSSNGDEVGDVVTVVLLVVKEMVWVALTMAHVMKEVMMMEVTGVIHVR